MATEWFINRGTGVQVSEEDPCMLMISDGIPDWVKGPDEVPEIAGQKIKVVGAMLKACAKCKAEEVRHMRLEGGIYGVNQCHQCGFCWYKFQSPQPW